MNEHSTIRVRFAPSPTGYLHVGGLRTALYNYLFARKNGGTFVLRIEDTDRTRYVEGAVDNLLSTLQWAHLASDEGPGKGGEYGPYVQSERLDIYRRTVEGLLASGHAYRCFCTMQRLEEMRKVQEGARLPIIKYDRRCLRLSKEEIDANLSRGVPHVVRMKVPEGRTVEFRDLIHGEMAFPADQIDDQVLMKSDGYPTYHLANVIDDHLMRITHVIRGEEWLPSTPKHVLLYRFFGWDLPAFAHLPLLLNRDRKKISKREGDVAVEDYRAKGYLGEALVNFVALLGWNPGTVQEVFTLEELIDQFSLERINKAGAIFNLEKLNWLNFEHLRRKPEDEVLRMLKEALAASKYGAAGRSDDEYLLRVIRAMRERVTFVRDFLEKSPYFFEAPSSFESEALRKRWKKETPGQLETLAGEFSHLDRPGAQEFEQALQKVAGSLGVANGVLIHALRLALSGVSGGPGVYEILEILGKEESLRRIRTAIETIGARDQ